MLSKISTEIHTALIWLKATYLRDWSMKTYESGEKHVLARKEPYS
jgi:hypothetical protein